jgi:hypothetical protein
MPQVANAPKGLNDLLERVYSGCMARMKDETRCSKISWAAAKQAGWYKGKDGKWHKRKGEESIKDTIDAKPVHEIIYQDDEEK